MNFLIRLLQQSGVSLDDARRFAGLVATLSWALVGLAAYTAIVLYIGWRVGVIEGAPLGGPILGNVYRQIYSGAVHLSWRFSHGCTSSIREGWPL
jgi:hypothetical protein